MLEWEEIFPSAEMMEMVEVNADEVQELTAVGDRGQKYSILETDTGYVLVAGGPGQAPFEPSWEPSWEAAKAKAEELEAKARVNL